MPRPVAFINPYDTHKPVGWSGIGYYMANAMERDGWPIERIHVPRPQYTFKDKLESRIAGMRGQQFCHFLTKGFYPDFCGRVDEALAKKDYCLAFTTMPGMFTLSRSTVPRAVFTDVTLRLLLDYYPWMTNVPPRQFRQLSVAEQWMGRQPFLHGFYASEWAMQSALETGMTRPDNSHVIPMGANLEEARDPAEVDKAIRARSFQQVRFLFVGKRWERKGGPEALQVISKLRQRGIDARLEVIGCEPAVPEGLRDAVTVTGFLSKEDPEQARKLARAYYDAHFFLLPTHAEAYGIVFCEAASYGVPSLAGRTGGVPTSVREGVNGHTLAPPDIDGFVAIIERYANDPEAYRELASNTFDRYQTELNWDVAVRKMARILGEPWKNA